MSSTIEVVPATAAHRDQAAATFPDLLPDRWRSGDNRRSFAALDPEGRVRGHCRGIDNVYHPDSRTLVLEVADGPGADEVADALLAAQLDVSTVPLRLKLHEEDRLLLGLAHRHGAVLNQACPPWRYVVGPELRTWADSHRLAPSDGVEIRPLEARDASAALDLYVDHYRRQHAAWSPAAPAPVLREENAPDFEPDAPAIAESRSVGLFRDGELHAQAVIFDEEVALQAYEADAASTRAALYACLVAVIDSSADGQELFIDAHLSEREEWATIGAIPGLHPAHNREWTGLFSIPVPFPGAPVPPAVDAELLPPEARWMIDGAS